MVKFRGKSRAKDRYRRSVYSTRGRARAVRASNKRIVVLQIDFIAFLSDSSIF